MPRVTIKTVGHVAKLAHLSLTAEECALFAEQLDQILAYAESIQALDTEGVEPMRHALTVRNLRPDAPGESLVRDTVLGEAPDAADGLFRVPKVLGG